MKYQGFYEDWKMMCPCCKTYPGKSAASQRKCRRAVKKREKQKEKKYIDKYLKKSYS